MKWLTKILTCSKARPNTNEWTNDTQHDAPTAEPIAVAEERSYPTANDTTNRDSDKNHKLHGAIVTF